MKNLLAFIMAGDGQPAPIFGLMARRIAFTMAEILLSLTIIGVVAAITLPSLTGNINERTWNTQRKALFSRLSQAVSLMPAIKGYGTYEVSIDEDYKDAQIIISDNATESFVTNGLAKVYKLNNICDNAHLADCGLPDQIINAKGSKISISSMNTLGNFNSLFSTAGCGQPFAVETNAVAFETANGESVLVHYNPQCRDMITTFSDSRTSGVVFSTVPYCANFIYDLNGKKGPNTVGKDVGVMGLFYPNDSVLTLAEPSNTTASGKTLDASRTFCSSQGSDLKVPNKEELMTFAINENLFGARDYALWSSSPSVYSDKSPDFGSGTTNSSGYYVIETYDTCILPQEKSSSYGVRCFKRFGS